MNSMPAGSQSNTTQAIGRNFPSEASIPLQSRSFPVSLSMLIRVALLSLLHGSAGNANLLRTKCNVVGGSAVGYTGGLWGHRRCERSVQKLKLPFCHSCGDLAQSHGFVGARNESLNVYLRCETLELIGGFQVTSSLVQHLIHSMRGLVENPWR